MFAFAEIAHWLSCVPLAWLSFLAYTNRPRDAAWWWMAGAFGVSWLADTAAHWWPPFVVSPVYLVTQVALIVAVFGNASEVAAVVSVLVGSGLAQLRWHGVHGPDVLVHTIAFGIVTGIVWPLRSLGVLRLALLVAFGATGFAWWWYAGQPGWWSWGAYQFLRFLGIVLWCRAATHPVTLRVIA